MPVFYWKQHKKLILIYILKKKVTQTYIDLLNIIAYLYIKSQ